MTTKLDHVLLEQIKELLQPLLSLTSGEGLQDLFEAVSWDAAALGITDPGAFTVAVQQLSDAVDSLDTLSQKDDIGIVEIAESLAPLATAVAGMRDLISSLQLSHASPEDALAILGKDILDFLIEYYLASRYPKLSLILQLLGIFSVVEIPEIKDNNGNVLRASTERRRLDIGAISQATSDPLSYIRLRYLTDAAGNQRLADAIADLIGPELAFGLRQTGLTAGYGYVSDELAPDEAESAKRILVIAIPLSTGNDSAPTLLRLALAVSDVSGGLGILVVSSGDLAVNINAPAGHITGELSGALEPLLITKDSVTFASAGIGGAVQFKASVGFQTDPAAAPALRFGSANSTRFEIGELQSGVSLSSDSQGIDPGGSIDLKGILLAIQGGDGDGFVRSVLPADGLQAKFDLGLAWSNERGLTIRGAAGLEARLPVGLSIGGMVTVPSVYIGLHADDTALQAEVSATIALSIGLVNAVVDRMGLVTAITFPQGGGNLGAANLNLGFKPPSGVGLSVDAAGVSGGGFLAYDETKQEYSGVLQLQYANLALQAFGLITTEVAGGQGYSLLALIDANFPPEQLGWGFTLNGVGGLLAVHRTASIDALRAGVKADALSNVLFPKNAITNAPQILAALDTFFPTAPGRFLFGPMALIGWGTPTLLTAALAIIVELPEPVRIILLGRLAARIPSDSDTLIRINMDSLGVLDLSQGTLALDATLFDSRLLSFTLAGDMALRASWTGQGQFLISVGGYHPRFTPPSGFPSLKRMSLDMASGAISTLHLESYLAITSNTLQMGANLHVKIGVSAFSIDGHFGFDALFHRHPFHLDADISGSVAVSIEGEDFLSVSLDATLTGPAPWNLSGNFKVHIVFFDVHKSFSETWGDDAAAELIDAVDVGALLATEFADVRSWSAQLPEGVPALVTTRDLQNTAVVVAHPLAQLGVHERTVPLGLDITRFGPAPLSGANHFAISDFQVGATALTYESVEDGFSPAQFFDLTDDQKLEQPSFERHDAGVRMNGGRVTGGVLQRLVTSGSSVNKTLKYETFFVDQPGGELRSDDPKAPKYTRPIGEIQTLLSIGSAGTATMMRAGNRRYTAPGNPIHVAEPAFVVVDTATLAPVGLGPVSGNVYSDARALLREQLNQFPGQQGHLQIVATHEMLAA